MATEVSDIDSVVQKMITLQGERNDSQFAKKLGISNVMWGYLKTGQRRPGMKFYTSVMRVFPELTLDIQVAMRERSQPTEPKKES